MYTVVTSDGCTFCDQAKEVLLEKGVPYQEFNITTSESRWVLTILNKVGYRTVPQIFDDSGGYIGGYTELVSHLNS